MPQTPFERSHPRVTGRVPPGDPGRGGVVLLAPPLPPPDPSPSAPPFPVSVACQAFPVGWRRYAAASSKLAFLVTDLVDGRSWPVGASPGRPPEASLEDVPELGVLQRFLLERGGLALGLEPGRPVRLPPAYRGTVRSWLADPAALAAGLWVPGSVLETRGSPLDLPDSVPTDRGPESVLGAWQVRRPPGPTRLTACLVLNGLGDPLGLVDPGGGGSPWDPTRVAALCRHAAVVAVTDRRPRRPVPSNARAQALLALARTGAGLRHVTALPVRTVTGGDRWRLDLVLAVEAGARGLAGSPDTTGP